MAEILEDAVVSRDARRPLCADLSQEHSEPLTATASRVDHWLLVEYRGLWSREPVAGSALGDALKEHLRAQACALANSRLLFIRRPDRRRGPLAVFFGRSLEADHRFFRLEIDGYDDVLGVDFASALAGGTPVGAPLDHPLFVVCTHGKRDRCCAKYGRPLYDELRAQAEGDWVWQATHVGGDRFAGNVVCLPQGLYFGRVGRADVWPLLDEYLAGRIALEHYRGRSCYPFHVQAAEAAVRAAAGLAGVDDLRLVELESLGDGASRVSFVAGPTGEVHEVDVAAELGEPTHLTCSAVTPVRPRRFVATAHRVSATR